VFIGGSNLSHGLNSEAIEKAFDMSVVNMGLHGGLGLRYIMLAAEDGIRAGDMVIIVPEYGQFGEALFFGDAELLAMVCDVLPEHRRFVSWRQWRQLAQFILRYGAAKLCRIYKCLSGGVEPPKSQYNNQGHFIQVANDPLPGLRGYGNAFASDFCPDALAEMLAFVRRCKQKGARVMFVPPVFQRTSFNRQLPFIKVISKALDDSGVGFAVPPEMFALDDELFYDTPYHLNVKGYPVRTKLMIDVLREQLSRSASSD
jgi:hypothetical protein